MIVCQNRETRSAGKLFFRDPAADGFRHAAQFGVGATFEVVGTLELQSDITWPALGAFDKAIVESGHWSRRIYTKAPPDAVPGGTRGQGFLGGCGFSASAIALRNSSTAETWGARRQSFAV